MEKGFLDGININLFCNQGCQISHFSKLHHCHYPLWVISNLLIIVHIKVLLFPSKSSIQPVHLLITIITIILIIDLQDISWVVIKSCIFLLDSKGSIKWFGATSGKCQSNCNPVNSLSRISGKFGCQSLLSSDSLDDLVVYLIKLL